MKFDASDNAADSLWSDNGATLSVASPASGIALISVNAASTASALLNFSNGLTGTIDGEAMSFVVSVPSSALGINHNALAVIANTEGAGAAAQAVAAFIEVDGSGSFTGGKYALVARQTNNATPAGSTYLGTAPTRATLGNSNISHGVFGAVTSNDLRGVGVHGRVYNTGVGVLGEAATAGSISGANPIPAVGVWGNALAVADGVSALSVGGYFSLGHRTGEPSAMFQGALVGNNGATVAPVFVALDNGARVFSIEDGGELQVGPTGTLYSQVGSSGFLLNTGMLVVPGMSHVLQTRSALPSGAGALIGTLTNAPSALSPSKWIPFNDNGTTRYVPAW